MRALIYPAKSFGLRRGTDSGWEVYDRRTNAAVVCDGRLMTALTLDEADVVVDILNGDHAFSRAVTLH